MKPGFNKWFGINKGTPLNLLPRDEFSPRFDDETPPIHFKPVPANLIVGSRRMVGCSAFSIRMENPIV